MAEDGTSIKVFSRLLQSLGELLKLTCDLLSFMLDSRGELLSEACQFLRYPGKSAGQSLMRFEVGLNHK